MLPSLLAREIINGLQAYVSTGFETSNPYFSGALETLVETPGRFFKGPYLSIDLLFQRGDVETDFFAGLKTDYPPYRHQQQAWQRLTSDRGPRSTLIEQARSRAQHCPGSRWVFCHKDGARIQDVTNSFSTARKRAGIEDFLIHDLRHTCAAWLVSAGVALAEVRDLLGHQSIQMTERYAHLAPENVRAAVARLDTT